MPVPCWEIRSRWSVLAASVNFHESWSQCTSFSITPIRGLEGNHELPAGRIALPKADEHNAKLNDRIDRSFNPIF